MSEDANRDYYTKRVEAERALAASADSEAAGRLHGELAGLYAGLLSDLDRPVRPTLRTVNG